MSTFVSYSGRISPQVVNSEQSFEQEIVDFEPKNDVVSLDYSDEKKAKAKEKANKIATRALDAANEVLQSDHQLDKQVQVIHHYSTPYWWWMPWPTHNHYYTGGCESRDRSYKKDDKPSVVILLSALAILGTGFYYTVKEAGELSLLKEAKDKLEKDREWIILAKEDVSVGSPEAKTLAKLEKIVRKEENIINRIRKYLGISFVGKAGFMTSGAIGVGAWFYPSPVAWVAFGAGSLLSTGVLLYKWGTSGWVDSKNVKDAKKIISNLDDLPKLSS